MRSHYAWLPPHADASTTGAHQVGVSFSAHTGQERRAGGRTVRGDIPPGTAFITGPEAIAFVNRLAPEAEKVDHHPDILINYKRVTLTYSTHSEGGLTAKDFAGAATADRLSQSGNE